MFFAKVAIVGVGLIGGSFGMALKVAKRCEQVVGAGRGGIRFDRINRAESEA
jgi:prephenate dehydrogenase